jgi:hypothetical protein
MALVEAQVPAVGGLEVCGPDLAVAALEDRPQQRRADARALALGCHAEQREVPVRLARGARVELGEGSHRRRHPASPEQAHHAGQHAHLARERQPLRAGPQPERRARAVRRGQHSAVRQEDVAQLLGEPAAQPAGAAPVVRDEVAVQRVVRERPPEHLGEGPDVALARGVRDDLPHMTSNEATRKDWRARP